MYELRVEATFEAAHCIPGHESCGKLHGHTYKIEVFVKGERLLEFDGNMLLDFRRIKNILDELVKKFDHQNLNELQILDFEQPFIPTAENLARYCYYYIKKVIETKYHMKDVKVSRVRIWEGLKNYCDYYEQ